MVRVGFAINETKYQRSSSCIGHQQIAVFAPRAESMLRFYVRRFIRDRRGSTAMIFGLSLVPMVFLTGMALDFTFAAQKRTRLNAAADAAALAAVTPYMMTQSNSAALTAATNMWNATIANLGATTVNTPSITISNAGLVRTVTVSYTATSTNNFPNVFSYVTGA